MTPRVYGKRGSNAGELVTTMTVNRYGRTMLPLPLGVKVQRRASRPRLSGPSLYPTPAPLFHGAIPLP